MKKINKPKLYLKQLEKKVWPYSINIGPNDWDQLNWEDVKNFLMEPVSISLLYKVRNLIKDLNKGIKKRNGYWTRLLKEVSEAIQYHRNLKAFKDNLDYYTLDLFNS